MPPGIFLIGILMTLLVIKRSWLRNRLIIASVMSIWFTSTNYSAIQITKSVGYVLDWPQPLNIENLSAGTQHTTLNNKLVKEPSLRLLF